MNNKIINKNNVIQGGPALKVPGHLSFGQYVIDKLREITNGKDSVALINGDTGEKTTYTFILKEVVNVATGLNKIGVKRGDVVAFCSENRIDFIITALAAICCGATITTFNVMYTKDEFIHVSNISKPKLLICSEIGLQKHLKTIKGLPFIKNVIQLNGAIVEKGVMSYNSVYGSGDVNSYEPADVQGATDAVFILYSSGTTGLSKGVVLTHLNALYGVIFFEIDAPSRVVRYLTIVPWFHAYGLMSTIYNICTERLMVYLLGFNPEKYLSSIQEYKINTLLAVPPIVVFLAKSPLVAKYDLSTINSVWCGAAPLNAEIISKALERMPNCKGIYQAYGMTETSLSATKDREDAVIKSGSGGYPLPGIKLKVVQIESREKLGPYKEGEVCIKGPLVMKGYLGNEAATESILDEEGYLKTGDIGYYDNEGCIFIVDRLKELIKYKGSQVAPASVERVLLQHNAVAECGVVGAPDEAAGELPTAFVTTKPGLTVTEKELVDFAAKHLSPASRLHGGVIFVEEVPKNPSGKILRRVLKQQLIEMKRKMSKL